MLAHSRRNQYSRLALAEPLDASSAHQKNVWPFDSTSGRKITGTPAVWNFLSTVTPAASWFVHAVFSAVPAVRIVAKSAVGIGVPWYGTPATTESGCHSTATTPP